MKGKGNIEHRTSNIEHPTFGLRLWPEAFGVRCSMFDVRCFLHSVLSRSARLASRMLAALAASLHAAGHQSHPLQPTSPFRRRRRLPRARGTLSMPARGSCTKESGRDAEVLLQEALAMQDARIQPPALYNLGHTRFEQGTAELKEIASGETVCGGRPRRGAAGRPGR